MQEWSDTFTLIAPDTPGYGASDPLKGGPFELEDFAHALAAFADSIGLDRFGVYGHHTGAMIAAEFARLYPDRVTATVANGYLVVTEDERREILENYFHDYTPQPDGQHLVHVWRRIRDQFLYFPWSVQTAESRKRVKTKLSLPSPDIIQADVMDLLRTGVHESDGYGAAFRCDGASILEGIAGRCLVTAHTGDLLYEHLERLPDDLPSNVDVQPFDSLEDLNNRTKAFLADHTKDDPPAVTATATVIGQAWNSYADTSTGQLHVRRGHAGSGLPVVLIHNLGSSPNAWQPVINALVGKRPFVAFGLPGHGETGNAWGDGAVTIDACALAVNEVMASLGIDACHVFSYGGGGLVALKLLYRTQADVKSWTAVDFWLFDEDEREALKGRLAPPLTPQPYGQHLLEAWYRIRDSELFWPWFDPQPDNAVDQPPETDPNRLHSRAVDYLKAAPVMSSVVDSALEMDAVPLLEALDVPATFGPRDGSPHTERCRRAAELTPNGKMITLSNDHPRRAAAVVALLRD